MDELGGVRSQNLRTVKVSRKGKGKKKGKKAGICKMTWGQKRNEKQENAMGWGKEKVKAKRARILKGGPRPQSSSRGTNRGNGRGNGKKHVGQKPTIIKETLLKIKDKRAYGASAAQRSEFVANNWGVEVKNEVENFRRK